MIVSILIKIDTSGPVFFGQKRVGKGGKIFKIYKFRSMIKKAGEKGIYFSTPNNDRRITKIGKLLRKYNIDELPQLINVLKGEMSLVGPRPEVPEMVGLYNKEQIKVLSLRPGMTGLAALGFRKEGEIMSLSKNLYQTYTGEIMQDKLKLDLEYLKNQSLLLDLRIILKTIFKIIFD